MSILQKHWSYLAVALAATAFACVKGEQSAQRADSTARNLTLAPTESSAAMKDVPAAQPAQPEKKATTPAPKAPTPKPAAPTTLTLAAGTRVGLAAGDSIRDRKSTRLNSSHGYISYAVFCLKKKNDRRVVNDVVVDGRLPHGDLRASDARLGVVGPAHQTEAHDAGVGICPRSGEETSPEQGE